MGGTEFSGEPWTVPKVYWTVMSKSAMAAGLDALEDVPPEWIRVSIDDAPFGYPDDAIDAVMDGPDRLPAKVAALRAHATQVSVAPNGRSCALSNNMALPIGAIEHYILAAGTPGEPSGGRTKAPIWKFSLPKTDGRHVPSQGTDEPGAKGQMAQASSGAGRGGILSVDTA